LRQYETTFVVDAHLQDEQIEKTIEKFIKLIESDGGKVIDVDRWGKRRLAYEINKKQYGFYTCVQFTAEADFIKKWEKEFQLDEAVLRTLTILVPKAALKEAEKRAARKLSEQENDSADDPDEDDFEGSSEDESKDSEDLDEKDSSEEGVHEELKQEDEAPSQKEEDIPQKAEEETSADAEEKKE